MHLGERESAILCVKILFPMRIHFTQNERVELRKLIKIPISERWGKQICLN